MEILHQYTLLFVTKSRNGPILPSHKKFMDQNCQIFEVEGIKNETLSLLSHLDADECDWN
mgnify:CR=1 FL=1